MTGSTRPSRADIERAAALAAAAIAAVKAQPRPRRRRTADEILAGLKATGAAPTQADMAELTAALARRGRGRPKGARDALARRAAWEALEAVEATGLPVWRNPLTAGAHSQCDVVAEAMHAAGASTFCTYDAVAKQARLVRRARRKAARALAGLGRRVRQQLGVAEIGPTVRRLAVAYTDMAKALAKALKSET